MKIKLRVKDCDITTDVCYDASEVTVNALERMKEVFDEVNIIEYIHKEEK